MCFFLISPHIHAGVLTVIPGPFNLYYHSPLLSVLFLTLSLAPPCPPPIASLVNCAPPPPSHQLVASTQGSYQVQASLILLFSLLALPSNRFHYRPRRYQCSLGSNLPYTRPRCTNRLSCGEITQYSLYSYYKHGFFNQNVTVY